MPCLPKHSRLARSTIGSTGVWHRRDRHRNKQGLDARSNQLIWLDPAGQMRPAGSSLHLYLPIICFAFSGVMAVVSTVTVGSTDDAQSSNIDFAMSIASFPPVG